MVATRATTKDRPRVGRPEVRVRPRGVPALGIRDTDKSVRVRAEAGRLGPKLTAPSAPLIIYSFTIVTDDKGGSEEIAERLYSTCADALFGETDGIVSIGFDRKARSFMEAATSAIADLTAGGCRAVCLKSDDIVNLPEIAKKTKRTREGVRLLIAGRRGPGDFPAQAYPDRHEALRLWHWSDVERWFAAYEKRAPVLEDHADEVAAINAALAFVRLRSRVPAKLRSAIDGLAISPSSVRRTEREMASTGHRSPMLRSNSSTRSNSARAS